MTCYGKRKALLVDLLSCPKTTHYNGDKKPIIGNAKTVSFVLPPKVTQLVKQGMELGHADDQVFKRKTQNQRVGRLGFCLVVSLIDLSTMIMLWCWL